MPRVGLINDPAWAEEIERHRQLLRQYCVDTEDPYFDIAWKAGAQWRSHESGFCHHRGPSAPEA